MPVIDHLVVVHELAGPLHSADAEEEQREAEGQTEAAGSGVLARSGPKSTYDSPGTAK